MGRTPHAIPQMLVAADFLLADLQQIVLAGPHANTRVPGNPIHRTPSRPQSRSDRSCPILGRLEDPIHASMRGPGSAAPSDAETENLCKVWGGYLGEVVRRRWGGEWVLETYPGGKVLTVALNVLT